MKTMYRNKLRLLSSLMVMILAIAGVKANGEYPVSGIDNSLKEGAEAVIRVDQRIIEITETDEAVMTVKKVVTVMSEAGRRHGVFVVYYDDFRKVKQAVVQLLDEEGEEVERVKQKNMLDMADTRGSFATDTRIIGYAPETDEYPYTVVMEYQLELKNLFTIPYWMTQSSENLSVEFSSFEVTVRESQGLRYKGLNLPEEPAISRSDGEITYAWELRNLVSIQDEPMAPSWRELVPVLFLIPENFEVEGFSGNSSTWNSLGQFFFDLNDDRQFLPQPLFEKVHELTDSLETDEEKIRVLYEYLQQETRYVSIQLGLGGWQTFDARYVNQNGYGDCKALTNYMKAMLKEADIDSHAALVNAGDDANPIIADFPSNQFNHVILCVPVEGDTIWLECTSQSQAFNYLGDFTEDRHVLLLTENGGKLVRTPTTDAFMNRRTRTANLFLDENGDATVEVNILGAGFQQDRLRTLAEERTHQDQEKYIQRQCKLGSFDIQDFSFKPGEQQTTPTYHLTYTVKAKNVASNMGSRLFLAPNILESSWAQLDADENRIHPIQIPWSFVDVDSVIIHLPAGFLVEASTKPTVVETEFGEYASEVQILDDQTILFVRKLRMEKLRLPPSYYEQFCEFLNEMNKADGQKMVFNNRS